MPGWLQNYNNNARNDDQITKERQAYSGLTCNSAAECWYGPGRLKAAATMLGTVLKFIKKANKTACNAGRPQNYSDNGRDGTEIMQERQTKL